MSQIQDWEKQEEDRRKQIHANLSNRFDAYAKQYSNPASYLFRWVLSINFDALEEGKLGKAYSYLEVFLELSKAHFEENKEKFPLEDYIESSILYMSKLTPHVAKAFEKHFSYESFASAVKSLKKDGRIDSATTQIILLHAKAASAFEKPQIANLGFTNQASSFFDFACNCARNSLKEKNPDEAHLWITSCIEVIQHHRGENPFPYETLRTKAEQLLSRKNPELLEFANKAIEALPSSTTPSSQSDSRKYNFKKRYLDAANSYLKEYPDSNANQIAFKLFLKADYHVNRALHHGETKIAEANFVDALEMMKLCFAEKHEKIPLEQYIQHLNEVSPEYLSCATKAFQHHFSKEELTSAIEKNPNISKTVSFSLLKAGNSSFIEPPNQANLPEPTVQPVHHPLDQ